MIHLTHTVRRHTPGVRTIDMNPQENKTLYEWNKWDIQFYEHARQLSKSRCDKMLHIESILSQQQQLQQRRLASNKVKGKNHDDSLSSELQALLNPTLLYLPPPIEECVLDVEERVAEIIQCPPNNKSTYDFLDVNYNNSNSSSIQDDNNTIIQDNRMKLMKKLEKLSKRSNMLKARAGSNSSSPEYQQWQRLSSQTTILEKRLGLNRIIRDQSGRDIMNNTETTQGLLSPMMKIYQHPTLPPPSISLSSSISSISEEGIHTRPIPRNVNVKFVQSANRTIKKVVGPHPPTKGRRGRQRPMVDSTDSISTDPISTEAISSSKGTPFLSSNEQRPKSSSSLSSSSSIQSTSQTYIDKLTKSESMKLFSQQSNGGGGGVRDSQLQAKLKSWS
jgi:hypothetical protein